MSCGVGSRCGLDPGLLWLWHRSVAIAQVQPLAWELSYATGVGLKRPKRKKKSSLDNLDLLKYLEFLIQSHLNLCFA